MKTQAAHLSLLLPLVTNLIVLGCEDNIALIGRPTLPPGGGLEEVELVGEVERLDTRNREIHLRSSDGRETVVNYTPDARVIIQGREYPVSDLETGDVVAMQLHKDPRGNDYADLIRVRNSRPEQGGTVR